MTGGSRTRQAHQPLWRKMWVGRKEPVWVRLENLNFILQDKW